MNKIQFQALLITILILGGCAYLTLGKPNLNISERWKSVSAYFEKKEESAKIKKKKTRSNKSCHARDFFDRSVSDGGYNRQRNLIQYTQGSSSRPKANDLIVFGSTPFNEFGHVAIISKVSSTEIEIAQQNPGRGNSSRANYPLSNNNGRWNVGNQYVLGWLRK